MKKIFVIILFFGFISCSNTDDGNPFLPNVPVSETVRLSNPSSLDLQVPSGYISITGGISGIFVYNLNNTTFYAFDRACPHVAPQNCAPMVVNDGINMECPCDGAKFAMPIGGQPQSGTQYAARQYQVIKNGDTLFITNF
ncbi:MAG: Rieske 2Fe-2S domain-containing protein [Aureibaculum sp.]|nr:Rieske 2Fe-2S domain-containing protein [Aureibaculum sp.]